MSAIPQANLSPFSDPSLRAARTASSGQNATDVGSFDMMLGRALDRASSASSSQEAREAAESFVAEIFIKPLLASVRDQSNAPAPFAPTQAERQFGGMLDGVIAKDVVRASRLPIVDRLARDLLERAA
ncbi:MAG: hypothetical protein AAF356_02600 [Planctomycetota bacterium]